MIILEQKNDIIFFIFFLLGMFLFSQKYIYNIRFHLFFNNKHRSIVKCLENSI